MENLTQMEVWGLAAVGLRAVREGRAASRAEINYAASVHSEVDVTKAKEEVLLILGNHRVGRGGALALRSLVRDGKIDGSYFGGPQECGCFYGSLMKVLNEDPSSPHGEIWRHIRRVRAYHSVAFTHVERMVYTVMVGDKPATNLALAMLDDWITEWLGDD